MNKASVVVRYQTPSRSVDLYRVAGATGNVAANHYQLSDLEMALYYYANDDISSGNEYMKSHLKMHPDNITANLISGQVAIENSLYDEAEYFLRKAVEFSPSDFYLRFKLGEFYIDRYKETQNLELKERALEQFKLARKFNPESRKLTKDIENLLSGKEADEIE
jgi:tetratricopeptide (TPR) repeat protein